MDANSGNHEHPRWRFVRQWKFFFTPTYWIVGITVTRPPKDFRDFREGEYDYVRIDVHFLPMLAFKLEWQRLGPGQKVRKAAA